MYITGIKPQLVVFPCKVKMKRRHKIIINRVQTCTKNYFQESSLHGFHYITDQKSSKFKSYFWALVCTISTCLCFMLIRSQFMSYYSNRITTTIATTAFPVWEVPFPAVTICNFNVVYKDATIEIKELLNNRVSPLEIDNFFADLSVMVASAKLKGDIKWHKHKKIIAILQRMGYTTDVLMAQLAQPCAQMISDCFWNAKQSNCSEIFTLVKTTSGFCCSFNYKGIKTNQQFREIYTNGVGPSFGLSVRLNAEENKYLSSITNTYGIDVAVHENIKYPDLSIYSTTLRAGSDVSLAIIPEIIQSDENVKEIDITTRGCAFADEIKLDWSYNYSYGTCINECKARALTKLCGCIPYYYYPIYGKHKYCTLLDTTCVKTNHIRYKNSKIELQNHNALECNCYPQCNEISYSYRLDQELLKTSESETKSNESVLQVYFEKVSCTKLQKSVFITWELILGKNLVLVTV
ncbi:sodium channel protein Nach-like [Tribolium madens]|uniref:sodium channel protein Nach-like n=1 Tax=Tribolium madens TaxID=41895 RepID=UPI001CF752D1|nr:sodium channel protein Nach-like [Tribolium madens]